MFCEESLWLRRTIEALELQDGEALDVGSSTLGYRRDRQPHIERNVVAPLRRRGVELRTLDVRDGEGVDYVCDLTAPAGDPAAQIGARFALVLCTNVLVHVADARRGARALRTLVAPGGWLIVTTPQRYRRVGDPLDNGLRPSPRALADLVAGATGFEVVRRDSVRIDEPRYYRRSLRPSFHRLGRLWVPVPGALEQLCRVVAPLRWRVSCAVLRRGTAT